MLHRITVIAVSVLLLGIMVVWVGEAQGWPKGDSNYYLRGGGFWIMMGFAVLESMVLMIIGMVKVSSRTAPPGSIGTEVEEVPKGYLSPQFKGGSYLLAGGLILSPCLFLLFFGWLFG